MTPHAIPKSAVANSPGAQAKVTHLLGESLLEDGLISLNQLQHALQVQHDSLQKKRLGDIFVELGYITKRQLRDVTRKYQHRLPIGALLVENCIITAEQLAEALTTQNATSQPLGQVLIEKQFISEEQLAITLSQQTDYAYIFPHKRLVDRGLIERFQPNFLKQNCILPLFEDKGVVTFLVSNPLDRALTQLLNGYVKGAFDLAVGPKSAIERVLNEALQEQRMLTALTKVEPGGTDNTTFSRYDLERDSSGRGTDSQAINIVDYLLANAIRERASDIHIDSLYNKLRVRHRIDGKLVFSTDLPQQFAELIVRRIKVLAKIDVADMAKFADGHIYVKLDGREIDLRVSVCETVLGAAITIRVLSKEIGLRDLESLGMLPRVLTNLKHLLDTNSSLILFAGPTGSGKTTSVYACLNYLNKSDFKICTIESPVEYSIEGIAQVQIRNPSEEALLEMVKTIMHQDPDVIVLGEITNEASALAALQAALSGHKVFSTIHTEDSFGAIFRLMEMGMRTYLLSSTGVAVQSQRLVRKTCSHCRIPYAPPRDLYRQFKIKGADPDRWTFLQGKGCERCGLTGFYDRIGLFEILTVNDDIRNAFLESQHAASIRKIAQSAGQFLSLRQAGFISALRGDTTLNEVMGILSYSERQASAAIGLNEADIQYWMGEAERPA